MHTLILAFEPTTMAVAAFLAQKACAVCVTLPRRRVTPRRVRKWVCRHREALAEAVTEEVSDTLLSWAGSHPAAVTVYFLLLVWVLVY